MDPFSICIATDLFFNFSEMNKHAKEREKGVHRNGAGI